MKLWPKRHEEKKSPLEKLGELQEIIGRVTAPDSPGRLFHITERDLCMLQMGAVAMLAGSQGDVMLMGSCMERLQSFGGLKELQEASYRVQEAATDAGNKGKDTVVVPGKQKESEAEGVARGSGTTYL